jgi:hypothetical protein
MSNLKYRKEFLTKIFLLLYFLLGAVWFYLYSRIVFGADVTLSSFSDLLMAVYWFLPSILALVALLALIFRKAVRFTLWICSLFWIFLSIGELMEGKPVNPGAIQIWAAAILSLACIGYLLFYRREKY